ARFMPCQLANESNRFQVPPKRVLKFPMGVGVFSLFSARSAEVKSCCRSSLPNTYTGSFPRVAVSEKVSRGRKTDRASRMSADATFVSASATLRSGFFSSAILTACGRGRVGCAAGDLLVAGFLRVWKGTAAMQDL